MIQKSSEHDQRCSKIVEANAICQNFQMWFELPNRSRVANDDITIMNRSQITAKSRFVNWAVDKIIDYYEQSSSGLIGYGIVVNNYFSLTRSENYITCQ